MCIIKAVILLISVLLLTHCAQVTDNSHLQVNSQLVSPYALSAQEYLMQAKSLQGDEQKALLIKAAGRFIQDGQWKQGRNILARIEHLPRVLENEKLILLAKVDLIQGQNQAAILKLSKLQQTESMALYYQVQYHEMLAYAYQQTHHPVESISERIKLNELLPDSASRMNNLRALWLTLTALPNAELHTLIIESNQPELKGWMQLAAIARQQYSKPNVLLEKVRWWKSQYPHHPANAILSRDEQSQYLFARPSKMALLLPLSGPLSGPGQAVRDGFMSALHQNTQSPTQQVQSYDTHQKDVIALYHQAVNEGAQYIVGPLSKNNAANLATLAPLVPTLLLNDLNQAVRPNMYQFGLSPIREARQVATKARNDGHYRALVIAPTDEWGQAVATAFIDQWQSNGGKVTDTLFYRKQDKLNQRIRDVLHITQSIEREKKLKALIGRNVASTPRRRQDFDMIFLLAYPSTARQIKPLLNYYYAGDIPVYATSSVYSASADKMKNRDLDGVMFLDMPWVFTHNMGSRNWPETLNSYNRLYALGMDSYALSTQLNQLLLFPALGVSDNSGILYLTSTGQIARILTWGEFKSGLAKPSHDNAF